MRIKEYINLLSDKEKKSKYFNPFYGKVGFGNSYEDK
jgi:hypothetical protein